MLAFVRIRDDATGMLTHASITQPRVAAARSLNKFPYIRKPKPRRAPPVFHFRFRFAEWRAARMSGRTAARPSGTGPAPHVRKEKLTFLRPRLGLIEPLGADLDGVQAEALALLLEQRDAVAGPA